MRHTRLVALLSLFVFFSSLVAYAQPSSGELPRVIRYQGTLKNVDGSPRSGTVGVSFAIYADQQGGAALWQEIQNVLADEQGRYTVLLGGMHSEGLPAELFAGFEARWLGIRVENEPEQPRTLLTAVPYALKAADAETLGGKPLSAFVLSDSADGNAGRTSSSGSTTSASGSLGRIQPLSINPASTGTQNHLPLWTDNAGTLGDSTLYQSGSNVGVGTTNPQALFQVGTDFAFMSNWPTFGLNLYYDGGWRYSTSNSGSLVQQDYGNNGLSIAVAGAGTAGSPATISNAMFLSGNNGYVGMGTMSPKAPLQIGPDLTLSGAWPSLGYNLYYNGGWKYATTNSASLIYQDYGNNGLTIAAAPSGTAGASVTPASAMFVAGNANVGIGTTAPTAKLDVVGNVKISGTISASNLNSAGTTTFTGTPSGSGVGQGTFYINPASANPTDTLLGAAVGGSQMMKLDAGGNLTAAGALSGTSLALPATSSATAGVVTLGGARFLHNYPGATGSNTFIGKNAGNFTLSGDTNTGVGTSALASLTTAIANTAVGSGAMSSVTSGGNNTAVGYGALNAIATTTENTAVGSAALTLNVNSDNTAVGSAALGYNTNGFSNTAVGKKALWSNTTAPYNTAVGMNALLSNTTGTQNTAVGWSALVGNITGSYNTAVGSGALIGGGPDGGGGYNTAVGAVAMQNSTSASGTTAVGAFALQNNNSGTGNTAVGYQALQGSQWAMSNNTALGYKALLGNGLGEGNTAVGASAMLTSSGSSNTAIGISAMSNSTASGDTAVGASALVNDTGGRNTAVGYNALTANTTAVDNVAVGWNALNHVTGGQGNTAVGSSALSATSGYENTSVGALSMQSNTTGASNTAVGYGALQTNTYLGSNTAIGAYSLNKNTNGSNTAVGYSAMYSNTTGRGTALGSWALYANTTGQDNIAVGNNALYVNTSGNLNTAVGTFALEVNVSGGSNTAVGANALQANSADNNTAVGGSALTHNSTGANNIAIGHAAGYNATTGSNNIYIGSLGVAAEGNTIRIGTTGTHTQTYIAGVIHGDGSGLTNLSAGSLPSNVALKDSSNSFTASQTITGPNTTLTVSGGAIGVSASGGTDGVYGYSIDGSGVYGNAMNGDAIVGRSANGNGVYGDSSNGFGVEGHTANPNLAGVIGTSSVGSSVPNGGGIGVMGYAVWGYGIYGRSDHNYAGYFEGDVTVTGTLTKPGGSFKIDHPLDPSNKYLSHSFVESPDMMNIYNGNITTGADGIAVVELPDWFEALNRDFRYQLTVIGQFAQAIIVDEVKNNRFTIQTDKPNVKVSWQVTGIRKDAWANDHRIPVEQEKPADERGMYLYPQGFGQTAEKTIGRWAPKSEGQ